MALQTINVGNFVNDGTGDDLRTAFTKINNNFDEIELQAGQNNTISNVGVGIGIFKEKVGVDLKLKSLVAGPGIQIVNDTSNLIINNTANKFITVNADTGTITATSVSEVLNIVGGTGIDTSINGNTLTITGSSYNIETDTSPTLGGNLNLNNFNINGIGSTISASIINGNLSGNVFGNVNGNVNGDVKGSVFGNDSSILVDGHAGVLRGTHIGNLIGDVEGTLTGTVFGNLNGNVIGLHTGTVNGDLNGNSFGNHFGDVLGNLTGLVFGIDIRSFDFGPISGDSDNPIQWLLMNVSADMGTIASPSSIGIDLGLIL